MAKVRRTNPAAMAARRERAVELRAAGQGQGQGQGQGSGAGPTTEIGSPTSFSSGIAPWGAMFLGDELELVAALQFPQSVTTYHGMRNDSQVEGLYAGTTLPIRRYTWMIDRNGCDETQTENLAKDLNLPIRGKKNQPKGRSKNRFVHDQHLYHALLAIIYGFYPMEQAGEVDADGYWRLRKLAPRPPHTIMNAIVNKQGGLDGVQQMTSNLPGVLNKPIPVDRLVWYAWDKEGANWYGRSMLRSIYKNYLIKDRLLRVDALKQERNGMGLPVAKGAPGHGRTDLLALQRQAARARAGETSSIAIPNGADLTLEGVRGTLPDTIGSIRFHNEEMGRRFLMMFMQLGESSHGNRALGETFVDFFQENQDTVANWYADTTTEHVIEDWWDWNVDPNAEYTPLLCYERSDDPNIAFADMKLMIDSNVIQVDDELEEAVREAMDLPEKDTSTTRVNPALVNPAADPNNTDQAATDNNPSPGNSPQAERQERAVRAGADSPALLLPDRPLRRQPRDYEVAAQVNFLEMEKDWVNRLDNLFEEWKSQVIPEQVASIKAAIQNTKDVAKLADLSAPAIGQAMLASVMEVMYEDGVNSALQEAIAQNVFIERPNADDYTSNLAPRAGAVDEMQARTLGQMAGGRAVRMAGGKMTRAEIADEVETYLDGIKHSMLKDRLGGALMEAYNTGRRAVFAEGPAATYYASEILDANTCQACTAVDGTTYTSLGDAERDYVGGYVSCSGGDRCRGTLIAVYAESGKSEEF